jgi:preprotein translocase subunit YajC
MLFSSIAYAQEAGAAAQPSILETMAPMAIIFAIFFFLIIRPQQKRMKKQQEFVQALKKGDSVLTSSGIFGTIEGLTEKFVTLEIADDVRIRVLRTQISSPANEES